MDNSSVIDGTATPVRDMTLRGVMGITAVRQVLILVGLAASVAAGLAVVLWSQEPDYRQLYGNPDGSGGAEVAGALRAAGIDYRLNTDTGAVLVPASALHDARLELASQGLPQASGGGMELLREQSGFGVSQFMESARYQHALETELARTISHLGAVRDARVHLALPRQTTFIRDRRKASASVLLQLYRNRELEANQATAIVNLVAASVPELASDDVTLIDQNGRLLSAGDGEGLDMAAGDPFDEQRKLEAVYKRRIEELLTPLVGPGRVRAQVVADLDFTVTEETRESYNPENVVVRSEQVSEERRVTGGAPAAGIPGALSNQPPQTGAEGAVEAGAEDAAEPVNTVSSSTRNYEVDRTITRTRPERGAIERLSVAVLVDGGSRPGETAGDAAPGEAGDVTGGAPEAPEPLSAAEIERYTALVKEAVGFNEIRGDSVVVVNAAFRDLSEPAAVEPPPLWEQPALRGILKQVLGALLVLVLAFGLVRPMLRSLLGGSPPLSGEYLEAGAAAAGGGTARLSGSRPALGGPGFDEKVAAAKNITGHDPARVAQVVRKWVATND